MCWLIALAGVGCLVNARSHYPALVWFALQAPTRSPPLQDPHHLYFLFDLMAGGDLMDVLVAEAKIIKHPVPSKSGMRSGVLAPKVKMWQVCARPAKPLHMSAALPSVPSGRAHVDYRLASSYEPAWTTCDGAHATNRLFITSFICACPLPQGMEEPMAKFYVASIVLALEFLHDNGIVYRWGRATGPTFCVRPRFL